MSNPLPLLFLLLLLSCSQPKHYSKTPLVENNKIIGQMAPLDMVFIPGDKKMASFYMSVSEEPNINYLIYLRWLMNTYGKSFPEIVDDALPKNRKTGDLFNYNDPYLSDYLTHPAFSYYPVTGLSWEQIQDYMHWKSDRLNEAILVEGSVLNFNILQIDEDNFNTEAYYSGQYEGSVNKPLIDNYTGKERSAKFNDGILFAGFRLATEAEWEYASQAKFQKTIDRKRCLQPLSPTEHQPYGKNYFLLRWQQAYGDIYHLDEPNTPDAWGEIFNEPELQKKALSYTPNDGDLSGIPQRLTSIADYNTNHYGLINMETNVKEWVMDAYEETFDPSVTNTRTILEKSGFKTTDMAIVDEEGHYVEKDKRGRLRYFRILGINHDGSAMEVGHSSNPLRLDYKKSLLNWQISRTKQYNTFLSPSEQEKKLRDLNQQLEHIKQQQREKTITQRLVKGGTWKNPGKQRMSLDETQGHEDVGFRCVLPYIGMPVKEKYKVKWH